eukprot:2848468-Alexandrium_andersonii.AAC.1
MSASLVGSEMCIRDRFGGTAAQPGEQREVRGSGCPSGSHRTLLEVLLRPCLLYTSDAADDM